MNRIQIKIYDSTGRRAAVRECHTHLDVPNCIELVESMIDDALTGVTSSVSPEVICDD